MSKYIKYIASMAAILTAGMIWAEPVAKVGTFTAATEYNNIADALKALEGATGSANYKLTLLADVELEEGLVFTDNRTNGSKFPAIPYNDANKRMTWQIIDLNGHTITVNNGKKPAFSYEGTYNAAALSITNGKIIATGTTPGAVKVDVEAFTQIVNVEMSSESVAPTCELTAKSFNNVLKGLKIANTASNGIALRIDSGHALVHSCEITADTETGTAVSIAQNSEAGGVAIAHPNTKISGSTAVYVDPQSLQDVYLTGGTFTGTIDDEGELLWISGGKYSEDPSAYVGEGYTVEGEEGPYVVSDAKSLLVDDVESSVANAFNFSGVTKRKITLNGDIFLLAIDAKTYLLEAGNGQEITIDLNGHTLNVFDVSASFTGVNCGIVKGTGVLQVIDSSKKDSGYLSFAAWAMDYRSTPGYANNMFRIEGSSTLKVESGVIANVSRDKSRWSMASYTVDVYGSAKLNVSGGHILNSNTAIRMYDGAAAMKFTMTGGEVIAGNSALWIQKGKGTAEISGGYLEGLTKACSAYYRGESKFFTFKPGASDEFYDAQGRSDVVYPYGCVYASGSPSAGGITISGDAVVKGSVTVWGSQVEKYCKITGGSFIGDGFLFWSYPYYIQKFKVINLTGGVFDRDYFKTYNCMLFNPGYENYYMYVDGSVRVENDNRMHFGSAIAQSYAYDDGYYRFDAYANLSLAIANVGREYFVYGCETVKAGQYIDLLANETNSVAQQLNDGSDCTIWLNDCTVDSSETDALVTVRKGTVNVVAGDGAIKSKGAVFKTTDDGQVVIQDGNYTTSGSALFDGYGVYVMADVGDGSYFDVNPASFSHDVSSFVYNKPDAIEFKTIQAPIDSRYYLGRNVEVVKEQN